MKLRRKRMMEALLLLAVLAFCGMIGARETPRQIVEAAVVSRTVVEDAVPAQNKDAVQFLLDEREKELNLLEEILLDEHADEETKALASSQKLDLIERMEKEAQVTACLIQMGYEEAAVVCGSPIVTIILSGRHPSNDIERIQLIDAVCSQIGAESETIKIILSKK